MLDTRELGRRPGASKRMSLVAVTPAGFGTDVLGVPEGSELELEILLEAVAEGVVATGTARGRLSGECVRCLAPIEREFDVRFQELYAYPDSEVQDDEAAHLDGELLDLEPTVRDAVVLTLPFRPLCQDDCPGLCPECGARLADDPGHTHDQPVDPRWAALGVLRNDESGGRGAGRRTSKDGQDGQGDLAEHDDEHDE